MPWDHTLLVGARVASAALAATVAFFGMRAYLGLRQRNILMLTLGASALALGYLLEGILVETGTLTLHAATAMEATFTLVGLVLVVGSLYVRDRRRSPRAPSVESTGEDASMARPANGSSDMGDVKAPNYR